MLDRSRHAAALTETSNAGDSDHSIVEMAASRDDLTDPVCMKLAVHHDRAVREKAHAHPACPGDAFAARSDRKMLVACGR